MFLRRTLPFGVVWRGRRQRERQEVVEPGGPQSERKVRIAAGCERALLSLFMVRMVLRVSWAYAAPSFTSPVSQTEGEEIRYLCSPEAGSPTCTTLGSRCETRIREVGSAAARAQSARLCRTGRLEFRHRRAGPLPLCPSAAAAAAARGLGRGAAGLRGGAPARLRRRSLRASAAATAAFALRGPAEAGRVHQHTLACQILIVRTAKSASRLVTVRMPPPSACTRDGAPDDQYRALRATCRSRTDDSRARDVASGGQARAQDGSRCDGRHFCVTSLTESAALAWGRARRRARGRLESLFLSACRLSVRQQRIRRDIPSGALSRHSRVGIALTALREC